MGEHGDGEARPVVTAGGAGLDVPEVVADAREAREPTPLVQEAIEAVGVQLLVAEKREKCARVDVACARAHHQALEWSHAHARLGGVAEFHGACARTIAEVQRDDPEL
jgi:hypothetical protein